MTDNQKNNNESISSEYTEEEELFNYILNKDEKKITTMLEKKIYPIWDYKSVENNNSTVLNISVYNKDYKITKKLIEYCKNNNPEKLKEFINKENDNGIAPIHYASFRGDVKIIKLLIENGADITKKTEKKLNVIHYCAQGNKPNALMYYYLKFRENNNEKDKYKLIKEIDSGGSTPLHWAVYSLAEDLLLYLINLDIYESKEDKMNFINQKDGQGYSALHLSIISKSSRIALKLLQFGANPSVVDKNGKTPLQLAISKKQTDIKQILENSKGLQICNFKAPSKQITKSSKNIICIIIFQIITTIIILFSTLPLALLYDFGNIYRKIIILFYFLLLITFFILYLLLLIIEPGVIQKNNLDDLKELIDKDIDLTKYCYNCFIKKTKDSKHCVICNNCYQGFDHHCYWINKCVAKRNYSLFITFLFETLIYLIYILIINIIGLLEIIFAKHNNNICQQDLFYCWIYQNIFIKDFFVNLILNILLILVNLSFLIPEFLLLILHIRVICTSYKEKKKNRDETYSVASTSLLNEDDSSLFISNGD